jgi:hypothetical protein
MARLRYTDEVLSILKDPVLTNISAAEMLGCTDTTISKHRKALGMAPRKARHTYKAGSVVAMPPKHRPIAHTLATMRPAEIVAMLDISSSYARRLIAAARRYVCSKY